MRKSRLWLDPCEPWRMEEALEPVTPKTSPSWGGSGWLSSPRVGGECGRKGTSPNTPRSGFWGLMAQQVWLLGSRAQAQQLWYTGLVALWHAVSSRIRNRTCVSYIGQWSLYQWVFHPWGHAWPLWMW